MLFVTATANPYLKLNIMSKKDIIIIVLKVVIYACTAILAVLGVQAMTSCSVSRSVNVDGRATVITNDTTYVTHGGYVKFTKSK